MNILKIATAQFEHKSGDKAYNLFVIEKLSSEASKAEPELLLFMSVPLPVIRLHANCPGNKCWTWQSISRKETA